MFHVGYRDAVRKNVVSSRLLGTNNFRVKAENERFTSLALAVVGISNLKVSWFRLADNVREIYLIACHVLVDSFSSFNQSYH